MRIRRADDAEHPLILELARTGTSTDTLATIFGMSPVQVAAITRPARRHAPALRRSWPHWQPGNEPRGHAGAP